MNDMVMPERYVEVKIAILTEIRNEIQRAVRPANEVILDDVDLRGLLKVSKRTVASWRERGMITYSKIGGRIYYRLADILAFIDINSVKSEH